MLTEHRNVIFKKPKLFPRAVVSWHSAAIAALSRLALVFLHWPEQTGLCPLNFNLWFIFLCTPTPFPRSTSFAFSLVKPSDKPPITDSTSQKRQQSCCHCVAHSMPITSWCSWFVWGFFSHVAMILGRGCSSLCLPTPNTVLHVGPYAHV